MEAKTAYPSRVGTWVGVIFLPLMALAGGAIAIGDLLHRRAQWNDARLGFAVCLFGWGTVAAIRQLRSPLPAVRLDDDGIEGDLGRERWEDVERVGIRWRWLGRTIQRLLVLWLRRGSPDPAPTRRRFATAFVYGMPAVYGDRIELPLWASKARVLEDVCRFYPAAEG